MKIALCVKQVPEADSVQVNPETGTLMREGVSSILNPFCEYALDEAVRLRSTLKEEVEIVAITMGPSQAKAALNRCLELGADRGILLSDRAFAGSDVWATAMTLKECILQQMPDFDLILTGRQAIDGDTAQLPSELAEMLGIPQVTGCTRVEVRGSRLWAMREVDGGNEVVRVAMPSLVSIGRGSNIRRFPSMADVLRAREKELKVLGAHDLDISPERSGLSGSRTQVIRVFAPTRREERVILDGSDPEWVVDELLRFLSDKGAEFDGREKGAENR